MLWLEWTVNTPPMSFACSIGIYTPEERRRVLEKFHRKRRRRSFAKKIRYNCRKNLADKRIRIKGRFVKLSPEEMEALKVRPSSRCSTVRQRVLRIALCAVAVV